MKRYVAALYAGSRIVTGINHGEAFSKLNATEQDGQLESGFYDSETGRFFTEEYHFYLKQVYLMRHGEASGQEDDAKLTGLGKLQVRRTAEFLAAHDLGDFEGFTSPAIRCTQSANIVEEVTGVRFQIKKELSRCYNEPALEFLQRIDAVLEFLPAKALIVTHSDFIINFVPEATGKPIIDEFTHGIPNASLTMIDARRLVHCGRVFSTSESEVA